MDATTVRMLLEAEREDLARLASAERDAIARPADALPDERGASDQHQADAASETFERECDATILRMFDERIAEVDHALRKLDAGTYGTCETCGDRIPDARLRARPDARFCERDERAWEHVRQAPDLAPEPGWAELALLPEDPDDPDGERLPLAPEQAALHEEPSAHRLTAAEIEEMEARITDELAGGGQDV